MNQDKITEVFVEVDDFCQKFGKTIAETRKLALAGQKKSRNRASQMSDSEIITILICFHLGAHRCFKHYYLQIIKEHYGHLFPNLLSYNRFIELQSKVAVPFMLFLKECRLGKCTGISFIDSTSIKVCKNQRIYWHKTFKEVAQRGKTSMGWFYGFKLNLIINEKGEILSFFLSKGNKDDRDKRIVEDLTKHIFGKLFGDKGYLSSSLFDRLFQNGVHLITKVKKNMKNHLMELKDKILLRKRAIIETVNDELKNICQLEHSRHRSINGFLLNIISTLVAYSYFPKKPSLNIHKEKNNQLTLFA
jgi:Transposase DDE domain